MIFRGGVLLAEFAVSDNEVKQGAAVPLEHFQLEFAGFDPGVGNAVVNQREQLAAGRVDFLEIGDIGVKPKVFGLLLQHFAVANYLVERRAQVVANVGDGGVVAGIGFPEPRFGPGRGSPRRGEFSCFRIFAGHDAPLLCNSASILASNFARSTGFVS